MEELIPAKDFAVRAHSKQERKFTGEPYVVHLEETAQLLWNFTDGQASVDMCIAAILHDVVEDTKVTLEEIRNQFGDIVANLVEELTIDEHSKTIEGKRPYLSRKMNSMSEEALTIKLCDRLSNLNSSQNKKVPVDFVKWYVNETNYIISNLNRELTTVQKELIDKIQKMLLFLKINRNI